MEVLVQLYMYQNASPVLLLALVTCRKAHVQIHADLEYCVRCSHECGCMYTAISTSTAFGALLL